jgi:hypothetical protein
VDVVIKFNEKGSNLQASALVTLGIEETRSRNTVSSYDRTKEATTQSTAVSCSCRLDFTSVLFINVVLKLVRSLLRRYLQRRVPGPRYCDDTSFLKLNGTPHAPPSGAYGPLAAYGQDLRACAEYLRACQMKAT